jgi:hypothetical protein
MESTVLGILLSAEFPGADVLREQARCAVAVGRCDCGCPTVSLPATFNALPYLTATSSRPSS